MYRALVLLAICLLLGCSSESKMPPAPDLHVGGSITLDKCGYTVTTQDGASIPMPGSAMLGGDPTPKLIHLGIPSDPRTTMAILWRTSDENTLATTVQFGEGTATDQQEDGFTFVYDTGTAGEIRMHETHLCGLKPDTPYSYRVGGVDGSGKESWSDVSTFRTAPDRSVSPDADLVFLIIGDTRGGYSTWGQALTTAYEKMVPDLIVFSGDATDLGPVQEQWDTWFGAAESALRTTPIIFAHGNHEVSAVNYFSQFAQPGDEQNFGFDYGPIHLTVANDSPMDDADLTGVNAQMLQSNLEAGKAAPWNLLTHHKAMWTAAAGPHTTDSEAVRMAWQPIVDAAKVDVDFNGHDHDYERTKPMRGSQPGATPADGTIYVVIGSAGAPLYDSGTDFWTQVSEKTYSFGLVRVRPGQLDFTAYRDNGTTLDTFSITK